jgi:hypothetical protein
MSTRRKAKTQRTLWEGVIDADVRALWEPWMIEADRLLDDENLIEVVFQAQGQRHARSSTLGRAQTPAETVLRLLLLKARAQLEFRHAGTRGDAEPGLSGVCTDRTEQSSGRENLGAYHSGFGWRGNREVASPPGKVGARARRSKSTKDAGRHNGRCCDIVLYLAITLKILIADPRYADFVEPALDSG